ncbi:hypothetical protein EUX98_g2993 [Antrodiella citrinella]|uniref:Uncharacterized protein n=1 Tax=Antrodiella citrinella TaxID=2447956 RepID=A0A4S4MXQ1_9APHY|nr:hypothetical protein EUX98_g2993 [Antrodiella citrinella]
MPTGWQYGNWKMTYSSQPAYLPVLNLQWDSSPLFPQSDVLPGQNNDLDSYQLENSTVVITAYGVDTPRRSNDKSLGAEWDDVYDYVGKGNISPDNNTFEIISWGYDTDGVPYAVIYETPVAATDATAGLDIESRSDTGPSETTLQAIKDALLSLGNEQITELVNQTVPLVQNGARKGSAPVVCDAFCVDNSDL